MYLILFISAIFWGLIFQKSKFVLVLQILVCAFLFSFNIDNPDYSGYYGTYYSVNNGGVYYKYFQNYGVLYRLLVYVGNYLGISFNVFRLIIFFSSILLILCTVKKLTNRINVVFSLYMIFPFVMDCIQIRNFIASAIVVFSFRYIIACDGNLKKNCVHYICGIIVASMFHSASLVYLIYIICYMSDTYYGILSKICFVVSTILSTTIYMFKGEIQIASNYLNSKVSIATFVFLAGIIIFIIFLLYRSTNTDFFVFELNEDNTGFFDIDKILDIIDDTSKKKIRKYLGMNVVFIPLIIFHYDMFRFLRNNLIIFSGIGMIYMEYVKKNKSDTRQWMIHNMSIMLCLIFAFSLLLWRSAFYPYEISLLDRIANSILISW